MRIGLLCLIGYVTIINYLDRGAISFAILPIQADLHLNEAQFGLVASAFGMGYMVVCIFAGFLVDRFGSIKMWALSAVLWSLVTMCMGLAQNLATLLILRILLGMVEAIHFPALLKTIADWIEPKWTGRSLSLSLLGVPAAIFIGAPLITYLMETMSWRGMFFILGILGLFWAAIWIAFFYGRKNPHLNIVSMPLEPPAPMHWRTFFTSIPLLSNCAIFFIFGYILFFCLIWIPGYLQKTFGLSLSNVGWAAMLPWFISCIFMLVGGGVTDLLLKKTRSIRQARTLPMAYALFLSALSFLLLSRSTQFESALLLVSLGLGFSFTINAPIYAFNADLFPYHVGTAQGIMICFAALAGIVAPYLTGWLVQTTGNFQSAIFLVSVLSLVGAIIAVFQRPKKAQYHM